MRNDWILDVLADLRTFAEQNGLSASAEQLGDTCLVIAAELSNRETQGIVKQAGAHEGRVAGIAGGYSAG
ncbi:hypothetical protein [Celeribacter litoreus]|uniref:hypothetical protein n=1 Tax=Celeribacter litoreus TaxID=2876714 RepID=UPI001CCCAE20|nr:hypothetical protein [Celeribacter litoreus]MCA0042666.1 hypothetical protein [Celeribacter litoreus]